MNVQDMLNKEDTIKYNQSETGHTSNHYMTEISTANCTRTISDTLLDRYSRESLLRDLLNLVGHISFALFFFVGDVHILGFIIINVK